MIKFPHTKSGYLCKKKIYILTKRRRRSKSIIEQTHTPINKKNQTNKEKKLNRQKEEEEEKWDQEGNSKISQKMVETQRENGGNSWISQKMAKTCQSKKTRSTTTGLQLTTFDNRKVLESIFHFPYHWRPNQDINFKKLWDWLLEKIVGLIL